MTPSFSVHIPWGSLLIDVLPWGPGRGSLDRVVWPWMQAQPAGRVYTRAA